MPDSTPKPDARRPEPCPGAALRSAGIAFAGTLLMLAFAAYTVAGQAPATPTLAAAATPVESSADHSRWTPPLLGLVR
jgi:hypothetical protein